MSSLNSFTYVTDTTHIGMHEPG